jgi:hypothetical protein
MGSNFLNSLQEKITTHYGRLYLFPFTNLSRLFEVVFFFFSFVKY